MSAALGYACSGLVEKLRARREEIEHGLLARVYGVEDPTEVGDVAYLDGFRAAASASVDFGLATLQAASNGAPPVPPILLSQARLAASNGVRLDVVLRRYAAGQALLVDFLIEEVDRTGGIPPAELRRLHALGSAAFDHLLEAVGDEYLREAAKCSRALQDRSRVELVERLLAGEPAAAGSLDYDLAGWHIGVAVNGASGRKQLQELARAADRRLLAVEPQPDFLWAWLGGRQKLETAEVVALAREYLRGAKLGLGEPAFGIAGWRLSHKQAKTVLPFAGRSATAIARYADQGLLASVYKDQVLVESLQTLYLEPLATGRDSGDVLRHTLRAYFAADCNISSAASALKVHRQTVTSRLRVAEERLGRSISQCALELHVALKLVPNVQRPL